VDQEYFSAKKFLDHDSARQLPSLRSETLPSSPRIRKDDKQNNPTHIHNLESQEKAVHIYSARL
jgi:hypothetical protein